MYEFLVFLKASNLVEFFLDEILHCLYVVVCGLFDGLNSLCVLLGEVAIDVSQCLKQAVVESLQLW